MCSVPCASASDLWSTGASLTEDRAGSSSSRRTQTNAEAFTSLPIPVYDQLMFGIAVLSLRARKKMLGLGLCGVAMGCMVTPDETLWKSRVDSIQDGTIESTLDIVAIDLPTTSDVVAIDLPSDTGVGQIFRTPVRSPATTSTARLRATFSVRRLPPRVASTRTPVVGPAIRFAPNSAARASAPRTMSAARSAKPWEPTPVIRHVRRKSAFAASRMGEYVILTGS